VHVGCGTGLHSAVLAQGSPAAPVHHRVAAASLVDGEQASLHTSFSECRRAVYTCVLELVTLQLSVSLLEVFFIAHRDIQRRVGLRVANYPLQAADEEQPVTSSAQTMCAATPCTSPVRLASQQQRSDADIYLFVKIASPVPAFDYQDRLHAGHMCHCFSKAMHACTDASHRFLQ